MSEMDAIDWHTRAIADLLHEHVSRALQTLHEAEREALERIQQIAPNVNDHDAVAIYLGIPRRALERRVGEWKVPFRKDGKRVLFTKCALDQYKVTLTKNRREQRTLTL